MRPEAVHVGCGREPDGSIGPSFAYEPVPVARWCEREAAPLGVVAGIRDLRP